MKIDLRGEIALVTGGTKNIGKETGRLLVEGGARVVCCYQDDEATAAESVNELAAAGGKVTAAKVDLGNVEAIRALVKEIESAHGFVSILVNNAAMRPRRKIADVEQSEWDRVHAVNLRAPFFLSQAVLPGMRERGWGRIVNVSGADAYHGDNQRAHVTASKLGIVGLMRALALETALWGVTVNSVVPGYIGTKRDHPEWYPDMAATDEERLARIPVGRVGTPLEVANAITFLCSREASYITGHDLVVTGGYFPLTRQPWYEY